MTLSYRRCARLLLLVALLYPPARADERPPPRSVKEYTDQGVRLFAEGRYDEALRSFSAAYVLRADPVYLFNIAQCHRKAGRLADARDGYELFLREAPASPLRQEAEGYLQDIQSRLAPPAPAPAAPSPPRALPPPVPPPPKKPLHRRPWFWAALATATASAAAGLALGIALAPRDPETTLGYRVPVF